MSIIPEIFVFPTFPISKQLFTASGQALDGGMTTGGIRILSPEPGGRGALQLQPALQLTEWDYPLSSWLMSKINGEVFRIRLAPTPQVASRRNSLGLPWNAGGIYPDSPWSNQENWDDDSFVLSKANALEGNVVIVADFSVLGRVCQLGHVIGHGDNCYIIDKISYDDATNYATISVNPPLRNDVIVGDIFLLRPYFLGTISNGQEMRNTYDAENNGAIQLNRIILNEAII